MNPPIILGTKVWKDPQEFLDEVYKAMSVIETSDQNEKILRKHSFVYSFSERRVRWKIRSL